MALHHILVLAIVQGVTEFLPISSSGHLVVTSQFLCWPDQGLEIDVAVHVGSLFAVMLYFWRDVGSMAVGIGRLLTMRTSPQAQLVAKVAIASTPVIVVGLVAAPYVAEAFRNVELIAWTTLGFGILLWVSDKAGMTVRRIEHLGLPQVLVIGLAQVLALVPGTSRSGITMTAARFLGMERVEAARFSMLLSIPTILGAGLLTGFALYDSEDLQLRADALLAAGLSFVTALVSIAFLMRWLRRSGFGPFVAYRILLAAFLLYWVYIGLPVDQLGCVSL